MSKPAGRPKLKEGEKGKYTMSKSAHVQRKNASTFVRDNIFKEIVKRQEGMTPELQEKLEDHKLRIWKSFDNPSMMLVSEYADFKALLALKQLQAKDPTNKDIRECMKLLLDIAKEVNRLTQVSADKKAEVFTKSFSRSEEEIVVDMDVEE